MEFSKYFHSEVLLEAIESKLWYHGSSVKFDKFDLDYVYLKDKSNAQFGPGFYLTDSKKLALSYATTGGCLYTVKLKRKTNIKKSTSRPYERMAERFVKAMPDRLDTLSNWDENPAKAEWDLIRALDECGDNNLLEMIQCIWADCYNGHEKELCERLVRRSLIDGVVIANMPSLHDTVPVNVLVAYNPEILKIVNVETILKDQPNI